MWNRTIQAQTQLFDIYFSMMREVNESITTGVKNAEQLQRSQLDLTRQVLERNGQIADRIWNQKNLSELATAQSQLAADQVAEGMNLWRNYVRALTDSQLSTLSSTRERVEQVTDEMQRATEETARKAQDLVKGSSDKSTELIKGSDWSKSRETGKSSKSGSWSGIERRKAANTAYSGLERRKVA
jgi:hypothetical protein